MKKTIVILMLGGVTIVAVAADLMSGWSAQSNGLKMQVASPKAFTRTVAGVVQIEVACAVMNVGNTSTGVSHLARICLIDHRNQNCALKIDGRQGTGLRH